jgi:hypothetical protein
MNRQQVLQCRKKLGGMGRVPGNQSNTDIVYDHLADLFHPVLLVQQILA